jgi:hypothetical protein
MAHWNKELLMTRTSTAVAHRVGDLQASSVDYILLDGSSSMMGKWWDCLGALENYMNVLKAESCASHGIIQVFDTHDLNYIARDGVIDSWKPFGEDPIGAHWGSTPLYDAINLMGRTLRDLDPPRCTAIIVTDGEENGSKHTTHAQARAILDWMRAKGWQVIFLGADFNNNAQAKLLGANESNSIGVRKQLLLEAGKVLGAKRARNYLFGEDINFSEDERKNFGGYLSGPSSSS